MISWVIIVLAFLGIYIATKLSHVRHKTFFIFLILIVFLICRAISIVNSNHDINLNTIDGAVSAGKLYLGWLGNTFQNFKTLTGKAVQMDWSSTNGTFLDKINEESKLADSKAIK